MPRQQKKEYKPGTILNNGHYPGYFIMILNKEDCITLTKGPGNHPVWHIQKWDAKCFNDTRLGWFIVKPKR